MNRLLIVVLLFGSLTLGACNTFRGMGQDTQETGKVISGEHPSQAYHWDARDF
jgi:predicted small secreted protein